MDLALALVDADLGRGTALTVARELVLYLRRPGSQSQFSVPLRSPQPATDPIRAAGLAIQEDPGARRLGRLKTADDHYEQLVEAPTGTTAGHAATRVPTGPCTGLA